MKDLFTQLDEIGVGHGADVYRLAVALKNQLLTGQDFKMSYLGHVIPGRYRDGYTIQVEPVMQVPDEDSITKTFLETAITHGLIIVVSWFMVNQFEKAPKLGFVKHSDSELEIRNLAKLTGLPTIVDHRLNVETGLLGTKIVNPFNPTDKVITTQRGYDTRPSAN